MWHPCWRQDAVLVPVSDPAMHSGSAYPPEVIMSRCQGRGENFAGTPLWSGGRTVCLAGQAQYPAEGTVLRCPTSKTQNGGRSMHTPQIRPHHLHRVTRRALLHAGLAASVTLSTWPFYPAPALLAAEAEQPKRGGILRVRGQDPLHFDPHLTPDVRTHTALSFVYSKLVRYRVGA